MENHTMYKPSDQTEILGLAKINDKVRVVMGRFIVSDKEFNDFKDAENYIASRPYELLFNMMVIIRNYEEKQEISENNPNNQED